MNVIRSIIKINRKVNDTKDSRPSSYPFISGDTFRSGASHIFEIEKPTHKSFSLNTYKKTIFAEVDTISLPDFQKKILNCIKQEVNKNGLRVPIIVHNGDASLDMNFLSTLVDEGAHVFGVNLMENREFLTPIPIGLENLHFKNNGLLEDFEHFTFAKRIQERNNDIICNFNSQTNLKIREPLMRTFISSRHAKVNQRLDPAGYRASVLASKFVISPPGNGHDCHRTWESIYLGAVPIVHKRYLSEYLWKDLPIWAVDDWDEIFDASDSDLHDRYSSLIKKNVDMAFSDFWISEMGSH